MSQGFGQGAESPLFLVEAAKGGRRPVLVVHERRTAAARHVSDPCRGTVLQCIAAVVDIRARWHHRGDQHPAAGRPRNDLRRGERLFHPAVLLREHMLDPSQAAVTHRDDRRANGTAVELPGAHLADLVDLEPIEHELVVLLPARPLPARDIPLIGFEDPRQRAGRLQRILQDVILLFERFDAGGFLGLARVREAVVVAMDVTQFERFLVEQDLEGVDVLLGRREFPVAGDQSRFEFLPVSAGTGEGLDALKERIYNGLSIIRVFSKIPGKKPDMEKPFTVPLGSTVLVFAERVHKEISEGLKFARIWGSGKFDGQKIPRDYILHDGDVVELHM